MLLGYKVRGVGVAYLGVGPTFFPLGPEFRVPLRFGGTHREGVPRRHVVLGQKSFFGRRRLVWGVGLGVG